MSMSSRVQSAETATKSCGGDTANMEAPAIKTLKIFLKTINEDKRDAKGKEGAGWCPGDGSTEGRARQCTVNGSTEGGTEPCTVNGSIGGAGQYTGDGSTEEEEK